MILLYSFTTNNDILKYITVLIEAGLDSQVPQLVLRVFS